MRNRLTSLVLTMALAGAGLVGSVRAAEPPAPEATLVPESKPAPQERYREKAIDPAEMAVDGLLVRPLGVAATVVGSAIYLVVLPFAAISGDTKGPARSLVGAPAKFTFQRKLGDFRSVEP